MTARMSFEDQIKFLLSCVKWSVNGKIDFDQVASECDVVSKGAAAKRYERMVKQAGTQDSQCDTPTPPKKTCVPPRTPKKRKLEESNDVFKHIDDGNRTPAPVKRLRNTIEHEMKQEHVSQPPPPNYNTFPMFHPGVPHQTSFLPRPLPSNMYPGMPYAMPPHMPVFPARSHASQPWLSATHSNHPFMPPVHQHLQPFQPHPVVFQQAQDASNTGVFDEIQNYDFGNTGYEAMLNSDAIPQDPSMTEPLIPAKPAHIQPSELRGDTRAQVKIEHPPVLHGFSQSPSTIGKSAIPQEILDGRNSTLIGAAASDDVPNESTTLQAQAETARYGSGSDEVRPPKEEKEAGCIFICD